MKNNITIALGSDHAGYELKKNILKYLKDNNYRVIDCGTYNEIISTHYPIYGREAAIQVATKKADFGIVICGTGIGISNSANKVKGIRCAIAQNPFLAKYAVEEFDANMIGFGERVTGLGEAIMIINTALNTKFKKVNLNIIRTLNNKIHFLNENRDLFNNIIHDWESGKYTNGKIQSPIPMPKIK